MLRTDLFKTLARGETRVIAVRDTLTQAVPEIDIKEMDLRHCRQGRFGVGYHFLLLVGGDIQLGRDIETIGAHSRQYDDSSVAIGIVGGTDENGDRLNTRTPEQQESLDDLVVFLSDRYPAAEVNDTPAGQ